MVIEIHHTKEKFTSERISQLLPIMQKITDKYALKVETVLQKLEAVDDKNTGEVNQLEEIVNREIRDWHKKIRALGAEPKGLWFINFDSGDGYYRWKYPDPDLRAWQPYDSKKNEPLAPELNNLVDIFVNDENSNCPN